MFNKILYFAINISINIIRIFPRKRSSNNLAFIIPPDDPGSLGDAAMVFALDEILKCKGFCPLYFKITRSGNRSWGNSVGSRFKLIKFYYLIKYAVSAKITIVVGADVMDGKYSDIYSYIRFKVVSLANECGNMGVISPCSFNKKPSKFLIRSLESIASNINIFSRDDDSYKAMNKIGLNPIKSVDLAFAYHRSLKCKKSNNNESGMIGLNINPLVPVCNNAFTNHGINEGLRNFFSLGLAGREILPIVHDTRSQSNDFAALIDFISGSYNLDISDQITSPSNIDEIIKEVEKCCIVFSGRMHLAICAISHGVPVVAFSYQDKFDGLLDIVGNEVLYLLKCDADLYSQDLVSWVLRKVSNKQKDDFNLKIIQERLDAFVQFIPLAKDCDA